MSQISMKRRGAPPNYASLERFANSTANCELRAPHLLTQLSIVTALACEERLTLR